MRRWVLAVMIGVPAIIACAGIETPPVPNSRPTVEFTYHPIGVAQSDMVDLTVVVHDADEGDNLTVTWSISRGTLTPLNPEKTAMQWAVPSALGLDSVTVTVSDGQASSSVKEYLKVCTLASELSSRSNYLKIQSPYIIRPLLGGAATDLTVFDGPAAIDATVEAGVELFIDNGATAFIVQGGLEMNGTADEPVVLHPNDRKLRCAEGRGWWPGMLVSEDGSLTATYTTISYGETNLRVAVNASVNLENCVLQCSKNNGISMAGQGSLTLSSCEVSNGAGNGLVVSAISTLPAGITIQDSRVMFNGGIGLLLDLPDVMDAVPITIDHTLFYFNTAAGIRLENAVFPEITQCHFQGNGASGTGNMILEPGFPTGAVVDTLFVPNNYWGQAYSQQSSVDATITDQLDDVSIKTRVWPVPWLLASPTGLPN